jgi:hypothetical protein
MMTSRDKRSPCLTSEGTLLMPPTETLSVLQLRQRVIDALRQREARRIHSVTSGVSYLKGDQTLYAIPKQILCVLQTGLDERFGRRPWLIAKELEMEQWFTDHCNAQSCLGFCCRGPIGFPLLDPEQTRLNRVDKNKIHDLIEWVRAKIKDNCTLDIDAVIRAQQIGNDTIRMLKEQQLAYQGWLQTYENYQEEKEALKQVWLDAGANSNYLLGRNHMSQFNSLPAQVKQRLGIDHSLVNTFLAFYRRWELDGFASWDLPIQQQPNLGGSGRIGQLMELDFNPAIQLPVTMKLPSKLPVQKYLETRSLDYLQPWRDILKKNQTKRLAEGFVIHFYQEVILRPILGSALYRSQCLLDETLAEAFKVDPPVSSLKHMPVDTIKKVRLSFQRRRALN